LTDLALILGIYQGSNGDATRMLYRDLEALGAPGFIALNLFRACKCSERAKTYRVGRGYRTEAYARKDWSIRNLVEALQAHDAEALLGIRWGWAIDAELQGRLDPHHHILYLELPTGQVSFHTGARGAGPDFSGEWDGQRGVAGERICRWIVDLFRVGAPA
jgi:hypothetical protein